MKYYIISLLVALFVSLSGHAQTTISFEYDDSGNRNLREVISLKSASVPNSLTNGNQEEEILESLIGVQETRIYPNPTKGLLRIDFPALTGQKTAITVHDQSGKLVIQQSDSGRRATVDLSNYPSGFYIMRITIGQDQKEWKIIKD